MTLELKHANTETQAAWNANVAYWDSRIGDAGNDFVNKSIWPAVAHLLGVQTGEHILDIACGNVIYSRRLAALGAAVVAFDFAHYTYCWVLALRQGLWSMV